MCIDVIGSDASRVLNNLCTADIAKLPTGQCCEAFVTDIRGRVIAHVMCEKLEGGVRIVGQHHDSESVAAHIDRYIIREDAVVTNRSGEVAVFAISNVQALGDQDSNSGSAEAPFHLTLEMESVPATVMPSLIVGPTSGIACCASEVSSGLRDQLESLGFALASSDQFELARIRSFWPRSGREIQEKTLPQELDRDKVAISFTKGCYLGQETVARLDARGQLQKKLCLVEIDGQLGESLDLTDADAVIGKVYSSAFDSSTGKTLALANMRRGYFEPGTQVQYGNRSATVQSPEFDS
ncbi:MAG: aminomethyltransferase [Aureliella sp.]